MELNLINLKVQDWDKMVKYYQEIIGLTPLVLEPHHRYGWLDAGTVRVGIAEDKELKSSEKSRLTMHFEVTDLLDTIKKLEKLGCKFFDKQLDTGESYRMASFHDPEGNEIGIYEISEGGS